MSGCGDRFERFSQFYRQQAQEQSYEFNNIEGIKSEIDKQVGDQMNFIELDLAETQTQDKIRLKCTYPFSE